MRIEIWTDIICPWCGLGYHRLEQALAKFPHRKDVEILHRSFQLDEHAPMDTTQSVREMLARKMGAPPAQIEAMTKRIEQLASADGLQPYHVLDNRVGNTSLAHEFAAWASDLGKADDVWRMLYRAYFGEQKSIFDVESLAPLAKELGLDPEAAREALTSRRYANKVQDDGREARALGSSGVPFFVIDRRYGISGAQPVELFEEALEKAWSERAPLQQVKGEAAACGPEGCDVPEKP